MLPSGAGPTCSTLPSPSPSSIGSSAVRGDVVVACSSKLPFVHRLLFFLSRKVTTGSIWQDKHSMELKGVQDLVWLGQPALRVQDLALMSPDDPCYQLGIFFMSRVWNQTSRGTRSCRQVE